MLKQRVEREQHKLTQSAIQLGRERSRLEAERWGFKQMQMELKMQDVLYDR